MKKIALILGALIMCTIITSGLTIAIDMVDGRNQGLDMSPYFNASTSTGALLFVIWTIFAALFLLVMIAMNYPSNPRNSLKHKCVEF
jgi:hypothetical protein